MNKNIHIQVIDDSIWPKVKELLRFGWNENHIFLKSDKLLKWHYSGFGKNKDKAAIAVFDDKKIIGFRLFTPIELVVVDRKGKSIKQSVVSTLYYLLPEYRGMRIGLAMQLYMINTFKSFFAIASNLKTSAPMHRKSGAFMMDKMYRYILPLGQHFSNLMINPCNDINAYIFKSHTIDIIPSSIRPEQLANFWEKSTSKVDITALNRTMQFWEWRYKDSPIYKYMCFGGEEEGCIIIGRICNLYKDDLTLREEKIFRLLEFIPLNNKVWSGFYDEKCKILLERVSKWAQQMNCVACEFYITTNSFNSIFNKVGFKEINHDINNKILNCKSYFEPCSVGERLCNVSLYIKDYDGEFNFNKSYFTLSDADQDRPNIL